MSKVTTTFTARKQLAKVTDSESSRYALGAVFVTQSDNPQTVWQVATNGRMLAAVEADGTTDRPRLCPIDVWPRTNRPCKVELNGDWRNSEQRWTDEQPDGKFPKCDEVCSPIDKAKSVELTLNPQMLADLAAAIDDDASDGITLLIELPEDGRHVDTAVRVHGQIDGRSQHGVIMPMFPDERANVRDWRTDVYNAFCERLAKVPQWRVDGKLDAPETKEPEPKPEPVATEPEPEPKPEPVATEPEPEPKPTATTPNVDIVF